MQGFGIRTGAGFGAHSASLRINSRFSVGMAHPTRLAKSKIRSMTPQNKFEGLKTKVTRPKVAFPDSKYYRWLLHAAEEGIGLISK